MEEYRHTTHTCRNEARKPKAQNELRLVRDAKDNKLRFWGMFEGAVLT